MRGCPQRKSETGKGYTLHFTTWYEERLKWVSASFHTPPFMNRLKLFSQVVIVHTINIAPAPTPFIYEQAKSGLSMDQYRYVSFFPVFVFSGAHVQWYTLKAWPAFPPSCFVAYPYAGFTCVALFRHTTVLSRFIAVQISHSLLSFIPQAKKWPRKRKHRVVSHVPCIYYRGQCWRHWKQIDGYFESWKTVVLRTLTGRYAYV